MHNCIYIMFFVMHCNYTQLMLYKHVHLKFQNVHWVGLVWDALVYVFAKNIAFVIISVVNAMSLCTTLPCQKVNYE